MGPEHGWLLDGLIAALRDMSSTTAFLSILGVLGMCGLGLPIPEDVVLITAGFLAALGKFPLWVAIAMGIAGVLSGDAVLFFLGRRYGDEVFELPMVRRIVRDDLIDAARERVQANARFICFMARFMPGLRSPIYLAAGALGVPPRTYLTQDGLAACISVPLWVVVGWWFGDEIEGALVAAQRFQGWILGAVVVAVIGYVAWRWSRAPREEAKPT